MTVSSLTYEHGCSLFLSFLVPRRLYCYNYVSHFWSRTDRNAAPRAAASAVTGLDTFRAGNGARIERFISVNARRRPGTVVEIGIDASPWSLGGWLKIYDVYTQYFASD